MDKTNKELKKNFSIAEKSFSEGNHQDAIKKYEEILIDYPNLVGAINNIALSLEYLGQLDMSLVNYRKCSVMIPNEKIFINNVANIYFKKKDYNNAIKEWTNSLLIDDNQIEIIFKKSECLIKLNLRSDADLFLINYIKRFSFNTSLNTLYGKNLIALNKHKRGLEYLRIGTGFIEFNESKVNLI